MSRAKLASWCSGVTFALLCHGVCPVVFAGTEREAGAEVTEIVVPQAVEEVVRAAPTSFTYGYDGIDFVPIDELSRVQAQYRGEGWGGMGWGRDWYVVARRTIHGDPIFVDASKPELAVMTAVHGMGEWTPMPVAPTWRAFVQAVERVRVFSKGREYPVALEENPPSDAERQALQDDLVRILGEPLPVMWDIMTMPIDD